MTEQPSYRLPRTVVPRLYRLEITPDVEQGTFKGTAAIEVEVLQPVTEFVMNAVNLTLTEVSLVDRGTTQTGQVAYRPEDEQVVVTWPGTVDPGLKTVSITYSGILANDLRGFYRTTVTRTDGRSEVILATQCEATDARRVFPGWDEPDFKARFVITLVVDPDQTALSNGREVESEITADGKRRVRFAETMPMSTYLVALVVGRLDVTAPEMVGAVPVRIAARPELMHLTAVAKTAAVGTLQFFEQYFGIPYPSDKLDHVAIPDFAAGAMENLGCVTYREEALLVDAGRSAPTEQMQVVSTIAHETAHMWFGDLVTMRWWNGIWLNEAFATFMQQLATDRLHPEWNVWTMFGHGRAHALSVDGLESTRPIEYPVGPPIEAWGMFDVLTYQKGGAVLRMLEQYLGPETFRQGITGYLNRHRYGNTETGDLWDALGEASGQPVRTTMDTWVFQAGYPLVRAEWADGAIRLTQRPFRYRGGGHGHWQVPVVMTVWQVDGTKETIRAHLTDESLTVPLPPDTDAVLVNQGAWGFYRVSYDPALWTAVLRHRDEMTALERLSLVDDAWALVQAGEVSLSHMLPLWRALPDEEDPDVWGTASRPLGFLDEWVLPDERVQVQALVRAVARPVLDALGWDPAESDDVQRRRLRATVIRLLGTVGEDPAVRDRARALLMAHWEGTFLVSPELLTPLAHVVASFGDEADWEAMYRRYREATTPQDEKRYLYALSGFTKPELIRRTLDLYHSSEVRTQDGAIALGQLLANRHARRVTWQSLEARWDELLEKYPKMIEHILSPIALVVDRDLAEEMRAWLKTHPVPQAARHIAQTLEFQEVNQRLAERLRGHLTEELGDR
ncbi:putative peptidase M1, membrane alanine aminopeptidase [Sulfobacillus acidophilus TPY]|uniref:Aminopeptidase n=1 Tax=Sulfobacillus acidophilus (strain ATCC 700253 / DSM 10332 / NAL) TaxID=679936 RepID=G8TTU8_SULAD|nr:putative peptidase M1, membrane alanine aminopeptidase [Sulfobacillus acidophilus TPY]AEW06857.1 Membrane alanyl aminopeptidase [Sulfobacillus acidophilus DSM 10332]